MIPPSQGSLMVRPHIKELIERGNVTTAEVEQLTCNSWEWRAIVPALTDEAFVKHVEYALKNCNRVPNPSTTYEQSVIGVHAPELVKRLKRLSAYATAEEDRLAVEIGARDPNACSGTPGAASWGRCENPKGHEPPCTHDPLRRDLPSPNATNFPVQPQPPSVEPGENLPLTDPRFGTPGHMQARWKAAGIAGPFFIESIPTHEGPESGQRHYIRECNGRKCVVECNGRSIADAVMDALDAYEHSK